MNRAAYVVYDNLITYFYFQNDLREHLTVGSLLLLLEGSLLCADHAEQAGEAGIAGSNLESSLGSLLGLLKLAHTQVSLGQAISDLDILGLNSQCLEKRIKEPTLAVRMMSSSSTKHPRKILSKHEIQKVTYSLACLSSLGVLLDLEVSSSQVGQKGGTQLLRLLLLLLGGVAHVLEQISALLVSQRGLGVLSSLEICVALLLLLVGQSKLGSGVVGRLREKKVRESTQSG